jgi:hypothetical protein
VVHDSLEGVLNHLVFFDLIGIDIESLKVKQTSRQSIKVFVAIDGFVGCRLICFGGK